MQNILFNVVIYILFDAVQNLLFKVIQVVLLAAQQILILKLNTGSTVLLLILDIRLAYSGIKKHYSAFKKTVSRKAVLKSASKSTFERKGE